MEIYLNQAIDLLITVPLTTSGNTVTYEIFKADGTVVQSGSMVFVRDEIWKVAAFTPTSLGALTLKATESTTLQKRENFYNIVASATVASIPGTVPTTQEMLDNVRKAINAKLVGGAVQSYSIAGRQLQNYSLDELWKLEENLTKRSDAEHGGGRTYAKFVDPD